MAPLMLIGRTSLLAISTLTSEINFYSRLIKMKDSLTQVGHIICSLNILSDQDEGLTDTGWIYHIFTTDSLESDMFFSYSVIENPYI